MERILFRMTPTTSHNSRCQGPVGDCKIALFYLGNLVDPVLMECDYGLHQPINARMVARVIF